MQDQTKQQKRQQSQQQPSGKNEKGELVSEAVAEHVAQVLTFGLNKEVYGLNILNIKEIIGHGHITRVPMMPEFIAGVINLRGNVVPVVDLALRFSEKPSPRTKRSSIVILEIECDEQTIEIGITVDAVDEVLDIPTDEIKLPPSFGTKIRADFISGMVKAGDNLLVLLEIENILSIAELSRVSGE
ncbi:MAG: chemotaxis protein CheW [Moraxellaceae bacterium]|nr:MAG: chemotaxis protein CheW [Moraxellaceae bacterium]